MCCIATNTPFTAAHQLAEPVRIVSPFRNIYLILSYFHNVLAHNAKQLVDVGFFSPRLLFAEKLVVLRVYGINTYRTNTERDDPPKRTWTNTARSTRHQTEPFDLFVSTLKHSATNRGGLFQSLLFDSIR